MQKTLDRNTSPSSRLEEKSVLVVTCLAAFLFFNSFGSVSVALPEIQRQFGNSLAALQWITLMGVVTISSLSFCFGRAAGRFGQRRLYKIGVLLYAIGGGLGAVAQTFIALLGARAVMAVGLAMALPTSTAILASGFEAHRRGQVLGVYASAIAVGRMTGPTLGGFLLHCGTWRWIFWMNFALGIVVWVAVCRIFRGHGERKHEPFDIWGSVALVMGYPSLLIALTFGAKLGWGAWPVVAAFALSTTGLISFFVIESHVATPLIDLKLFRQGTLASALIAVVLSHMLYNPVSLAAPLYLQNVLMQAPVVAGFLLAVLPLSTALFSPLSGRLADRFDASTVSRLGMAMIVAGIGCYALLGISSGLLTTAFVLALLGAGIGSFTPANQKAAFASVSKDDYGILAAMLSSFGTAAGTIGTTLTVALMEYAGGSRLWSEPALMASAQQFAFACLVPLGVLALLVAPKKFVRGQAAQRP